VAAGGWSRRRHRARIAAPSCACNWAPPHPPSGSGDADQPARAGRLHNLACRIKP
jgi:hypothetical protein